MEELDIEHIPSSHSVHVAFFRDISNAVDLQSQLIAKNPAFEYALSMPRPSPRGTTSSPPSSGP